tara:strand:- start:289 stop:561 length:273 start_codon:yes stop_codon:yes gene_type:complete
VVALAAVAVVSSVETQVQPAKALAAVVVNYRVLVAHRAYWAAPPLAVQRVMLRSILSEAAAAAAGALTAATAAVALAAQVVQLFQAHQSR